MKNILSAKGFTLSEILVSLQIFSLITLFTYAAFDVFNSSYVRQINSMQKMAKISAYNQLIQETVNRSDRLEMNGKKLIGFMNGVVVLEADQSIFINSKKINDSIRVTKITTSRIDYLFGSESFSVNIPR